MAGAVLIANPFATSVTERKLAEVQAVLEPIGGLETRLTQHRGHATELAREACADGCDTLFVFSGDGTSNEVLNGIEPGADVRLGFIPGGGTSVLPRALGLPRDALAAARRLREAVGADRTRRISLGRVNGRRFAFNAGLGFDAEAVRRFDALGRERRGQASRRLPLPAHDRRDALGPPAAVRGRRGARGTPARSRSRSRATATSSPTSAATRCGSRRGPSSSSGSTWSRPAGSLPARCRGSPHTSSAAASGSAATTCTTSTTSTGPWCVASGRCRSRRMGRISETPSGSSSRASATP